MTAVLRLSKLLTEWPRRPARHVHLAVRTYRWTTDVDRWLEIQRLAWSARRTGRPWTAADFRREWLERSWWRTDRILLAYERPYPSRTVGAIGYRPCPDAPQAAGRLVWLAVIPAWRRRGAGRLLVETLEARCYAAGVRRLELETLAEWTAAVALYRQLGYSN